MSNKNCPFCNSDKLVAVQVMINTFIHCKKCGARGPIANNADEALKAWNKWERKSD